MTRQQLFENIKRKKSYLCVGLDTDITKIPDILKKEEDPLYIFNKEIIDATADIAVCYKPNLAFYESFGLKGWISLEKTVSYIKENYPDIFVIADAKRGDIGNTSKMYARAFFETMNFDAITVSPYMGRDSVEPFLSYENKWVILLVLTSNNGSEDFQQLTCNHEKLYETVINKSLCWSSPDNMMYVIGATKAEKLKEIRNLIPDNFLLIPGIGAQGGSLQQVTEFGINHHVGLLVNSSRSIIYAGHDKNFNIMARKEAGKIQSEMNQLLNMYLK